MTLPIINFCINLAIVGALFWVDKRHKEKIKDIEASLLRANPASRRRK